MAADFLQQAFLRLLFGPVGRLLPFAACRWIARLSARPVWWFGFRRRITLKNLALAFPELSRSEQKHIGQESLVNLFTIFLEFLTLRHLGDAELRRRITIENIELLHGLAGRGGLLLSGHFGNWELLALGAGAISGVPFSIVVTEQNDFGQLTRMRTSHGNSIISTHRAALRSSALLRRGGAVAMLADQSASSDDDTVMMFGIPTHSFSAPARLALRFRPRIIVGFAVRQPDGNYHVRLEEIPHDDLDDTPDGVRTLTQRYAALLESAIRAHPEQWLWQHRRWKNTPGVEY